MDPCLSDGLVLLRRYRDGDIGDVYQAVRESIPALSPWFAWCDEDLSVYDAVLFSLIPEDLQH
jgi:hypothetical protein